MQFRLMEKLLPIYRGVIRGLDPNTTGSGRAEWWSLDKDQASNYADDENGYLLTAILDTTRVNILDIGYHKSITDAYLSEELNSNLGAEVIDYNRKFIRIKVDNLLYTIGNGLDNIQPFYHKLALKKGYDAIKMEFRMGSKVVSEIALLKDNLISYNNAPDDYNTYWS